MSLYLAKHGFDVVGIDYSTMAIHEARNEANKKKLRGSFKAFVGNAQSLKYEDGEFDVVVSYHSLHHIHNVEKAISEMFRVCRSGGCVLISDFHEEGRQAYEHEPDRKRLLNRIERAISRRTSSIKTKDTLYNRMFICRK